MACLSLGVLMLGLCWYRASVWIPFLMALMVVVIHAISFTSMVVGVACRVYCQSAHASLGWFWYMMLVSIVRAQYETMSAIW